MKRLNRGEEQSSLKRKRGIYTGLGIAASFAIAVGGWALTNWLIENRSAALMSQTGYETVNPPPVATPALDEDSTEDYPPPERPLLTEAEIARVLLNWESVGREWPHEPIEGQLGMEEAIGAADDCLAEWGEAGVVAWGTYENARAYLCQNLPEDWRGRDILDPVYSYWVVSLSAENIRATLTINAVTGQIWKASLSLMQTRASFGKVDIENVLNTFIAPLDLGGKAGDTEREIKVGFDRNAAMASKFFSGNMVYATGTLLEWESGEDVFFASIELSLVAAMRTTQEDIFDNS